LISAVDNDLLVNVDQYGEHSDGRSDEERGNEPLIIVKKKMSNFAGWTILMKRISLQKSHQILHGYEPSSNATTFTSSAFPDHKLLRYYYFIMLYILVLP
jgi:hypothetical protein